MMRDFWPSQCIIVRDLNPCILHFEPNPVHGEIYSWFFYIYIQRKYCFIWNHCIALWNLLHFGNWQNAHILHDVIFYFCLATVSSISVATVSSTSVVLRVYNTGKNTPESQLNYTFVQLKAGYKTSLNVEISWAITVQQHVNYVNLMNIFVYRSHVDCYSLSSTVPSECGPSAQVYRIGVMK